MPNNGDLTDYEREQLREQAIFSNHFRDTDDSFLMSDEDDITENGKDQGKMYKEPLQRSTGIHRNYAIFRLGRKIKTINQINPMVSHYFRTRETPNADLEKLEENELLWGGEDVKERLEEHLRDVKIHVNSVLAREIILTASPEFFKGLDEYQLAQWIQEQKKFLLQQFPDNLIFLMCHMDESTPHCHAIVSFKHYVENKKGKTKPLLQHYKYFDGKEKLIEWQDLYAAAMEKSFNLSRGIKYSRAKHTDIQAFYGIIDNPGRELTPEEAIRKAQLLDIKLKATEQKLKAVELMNHDLMKDNSIIREDAKKVSKSFKTYQQVINIFMERYGREEVSEALLEAENTKQHENTLEHN